MGGIIAPSTKRKLYAIFLRLILAFIAKKLFDEKMQHILILMLNLVHALILK